MIMVSSVIITSAKNKLSYLKPSGMSSTYESLCGVQTTSE